MERDYLKIHAAILIVSIILFVFLLSRSRWSAPLSDNNLPAAVTVEVKGDVPRPGIYILDGATATVAAASAMAGLPSRIPEPVAFQKLNPGQSLEVLRKERDITIRFGRMSGAALLACGLKLDLNSASLDELLLIPHMHREIAASIIERRKEKAWEKVDDLTEISGVGPKTVQMLKNYLDALKNKD